MFRGPHLTTLSSGCQYFLSKDVPYSTLFALQFLSPVVKAERDTPLWKVRRSHRASLSDGEENTSLSRMLDSLLTARPSRVFQIHDPSQPRRDIWVSASVGIILRERGIARLEALLEADRRASSRKGVGAKSRQTRGMRRKYRIENGDPAFLRQRFDELHKSLLSGCVDQRLGGPFYMLAHSGLLTS